MLPMGANASAAASVLVRPTLFPRSLGRLLAAAGAPGADAYDSNGSKLQCAHEAAKGSTVYLADAGRHWQWAPERPGHERVVLLPSEVREVTLRTLGVEPPLFHVRGLLTPAEAATLLAAAEPLLKPSQVRQSAAHGAALRADAGRTTASAWLHGHQDPRREVAAARSLQRRVAGQRGQSEKARREWLPSARDSTGGHGAVGALARLAGGASLWARSLAGCCGWTSSSCPRTPSPCSSRRRARAGAKVARVVAERCLGGVLRACACCSTGSPALRATRALGPLRSGPPACAAPGEFYVPHADFLGEPSSSDDAPAHDAARQPAEGGTNRAAAALVFLTDGDDEAGGHAVFPFVRGDGRAGRGGAGGGTHAAGSAGAPLCDFPSVQQRRGLMVTPRAGDALLW